MNEDFDAKTEALLLLDLQIGAIDFFTGGSKDYVSRVANVLSAARRRSQLILFVTAGFRAGAPEVGEQNKVFAALKAARRLGQGPHMEIHPDIRPTDADIVMVKHRTGAFSGTPLDQILRANRIETVCMAGLKTGGAVLTTVRQAADLDYRIRVLEDCCADADQEAHRWLMDNLFPEQAGVCSSEDYLIAEG